jgi:hypothetical protein
MGIFPGRYITDRQERRRGIYWLRPILVTDFGGARRNRARQRRGDAVTRARAREEEEASEGVRPVGLTEATWSGSTR